MTDPAAQIAELQKVIEQQQDEIDQLKELHFEPVLNIRRAVHLTKLQYRLIEFLMKREIATKDSIMMALYYDRHEKEWPDIKILDMFVMKIRQQLAKHEITVETVWGQGWSISPENKQKIRDLPPDRRADAA